MEPDLRSGPIAGVPATPNARKLEVPVKRMVIGADVEKVINRDSMSNPEALDFFVTLAKELNVKRD